MTRPTHHANGDGTAFRNPWPSAQQPTWKDIPWTIPLSLYPRRTRPDQPPITVVKPDWGAVQARKDASTHLVGTWLGHASALAEFRAPATASSGGDSLYVLFDPIFSMRAGPHAYIGPGRFNKPPCGVQDLPGCDAVCISHSHYDHLDLPTVLQILSRFPKARWFVPLGIRAWLVASGADADNVQEMDWWDSWDGFASQGLVSDGPVSSSLRVSCVPAQHTSGRSGLDTNSTLWCGWVVERFVGDSMAAGGKARRGAVYHAGDTGYRPSASSKDTCPAFKEIGEHFGGLDLSFIPIWRGGGFSGVSYLGLRLHHHKIPAWNHCSPEDAVRIHKDVRSRNTVAVHFGTFVGSQKESDEALDEFHSAIEDAGLLTLDQDTSEQKSRAATLNIGQSLVLDIQ